MQQHSWYLIQALTYIRSWDLEIVWMKRMKSQFPLRRRGPCKPIKWIRLHFPRGASAGVSFRGPGLLSDGAGWLG